MSELKFGAEEFREASRELETAYNAARRINRLLKIATAKPAREKPE
jgi:hypothetical protein